MGIAPIGAVGVYHSDRLGQDILTFVVVSNDQVNAQLTAQQRFFHGGDAAVHGDDQLHAFAMELMNGNGIQTIAFLQPSGNVADAVCALTAKKVGQQAGGGDAIDIIVTKNRNFLSPGHGKLHPLSGRRHVGHQKGVRHGGVTVQIFPGLVWVIPPPGGKDHGGQGGVAGIH